MDHEENHVRMDRVHYTLNRAYHRVSTDRVGRTCGARMDQVVHNVVVNELSRRLLDGIHDKPGCSLDDDASNDGCIPQLQLAHH